MSSSDELPDWSVFSERDLPEAIELLSPASELAAILQLFQANLSAEKNAAEDIRHEGLKILAQQAVFIVQLEAALERHKPKFEQASLNKVYRSLRIIKDQMLDGLKVAGLNIVIPQGQRFDDVADSVSVVGWKFSEDFPAEVVAEVLEPIVFYGDRLVHPGLVVMGAPKTQEVTDMASTYGLNQI
jgi:molecular chaperone GrpE (heat shock protein)